MQECSIRFSAEMAAKTANERRNIYFITGVQKPESLVNAVTKLLITKLSQSLSRKINGACISQWRAIFPWTFKDYEFLLFLRSSVSFSNQTL